MGRRVVVTGLGAVSPLGGRGVRTNWERLLAGKSATRILPDLVPTSLPVHIGASLTEHQRNEVKEYVVAEMERRRADTSRREDEHRQGVPVTPIFNAPAQSAPFIMYAIAAAGEALQDAKWDPFHRSDPMAPSCSETASSFVKARGMAWERAGVAIGSGIGSPDEVGQAFATVNAGQRGYRRLSPFFVPRVLTNLAAGNVSLSFGLQGPNIAPATACAAGAHAIGDAFRLIKVRGRNYDDDSFNISFAS